ncbi:MAG: glycosyltransferase [Candidatus Saccharibacteria bacterium]|nr:glycosyltransferase [Candidatus Saccharibacteria bacterium]
MPVPDITIAIPTYNREEVLVNTIHDALNQTIKNIEVLVIDQSLAHSAATQKALDTIRDKRFRYFQVDPPSVTAARNFALQQATAPIIIFLDDDVKLDPRFAAQHLAIYTARPEVSAAGGRVMQAGFPVHNEILHFDEYASSRGVFTSPKSGYTNAFAGGNCSLRVADALKVGGFDTRYYGNAFREESDMSLKMTAAGMKIWYEPKAELLHLAAPYGGNRVKGHIFDRAVFYRNELFFTLRWTKGRRLRALKRKYHEYCWQGGKRLKIKRSVLFSMGLIVALWRFVWTKQTIAKERA